MDWITLLLNAQILAGRSTTSNSISIERERERGSVGESESEITADGAHRALFDVHCFQI